MNTKELRVGNYVEVDGAIVEVGAICSDKEDHIEIKVSADKKNEINITKVKPVPLTGELLSKCCEFDNDGKHVIGIDEHRHFLKIQNGYVILLNYKNEEMIHFWDVQSLHQLQNLYYALKNKELTMDIN